jgi:hypothetical protein
MFAKLLANQSAPPCDAACAANPLKCCLDIFATLGSSSGTSGGAIDAGGIGGGTGGLCVNKAFP